MNIVNKVTLEGLKKNRTRTIVTIIGVILSAAMITAVTTLVASLQGYAIDMVIADGGDWHAILHNGAAEDVAAMGEMEGVQLAGVTHSGGYGHLPSSQIDNKPYLHLLRLDREAWSTLPIYLQSGRLPERPDEVLVPAHVLTDGGVHYQVGDRLALELGRRIAADGATLGQDDRYQLSEQGSAEKLVDKEPVTLTVVGICSRLPLAMEGFSAPGFTLLAPEDVQSVSALSPLSIYFRAERPAQVYDLAKRLQTERRAGADDLEFNGELLRSMGISDDKRFTAVLYSLGAILVGLIVVGSVTLIHNSFSISVSERKKQYGLLAGAGATGKQLRQSVFFEAMVIGSFGIPLGIAAGILGIGVTVYFLQDALLSLVRWGSGIPQVPFALVVSVPAVAAAGGLSLATILVSAYIPARRSAGVSAIDAIRQSTDIKLSSKQVRTSPLTRRIFGLAGDLALKNLKRNRRRYRSTVVSLFISIVLFVSANSFANYLRDSAINVYEDYNYDLSYSVGPNEAHSDTTQDLFRNILALDSVDDGSLVSMINGQIELSRDQVSVDYYRAKVTQGAIAEGDKLKVAVYLQGVDSETFGQYAAGLGLDVQALRDPTAPRALVIDHQHFYDPAERRYLNTSIFDGETPASLPVAVWQRGEATPSVNVDIGAIIQEPPLGVSRYAERDCLILIMDEQAAAPMLVEQAQAGMYFTAKDPFLAESEIQAELLAAEVSRVNLYNVAQFVQINRNMVLIISVFSYGFIVLMSLITIANVFNTISTNINLRRRELAMLRSVGMTDEGQKRMLDFECIFYGLKALFYGLPASVAVTYLIHKSVAQGVEMPFRLPLTGMLVSTISVFLVVFISMKYSRDKVQQENIIDALKNENL